jgi:hypothetical protein
MACRFGLALVSALFLGLGASGCATKHAPAPAHPSGRVEEIHILGLMKGSRGPKGLEGFRLRLYASDAGVARGVPIKNGRIEILMFDRADATVLNPRNEKPIKVWGFDAAELEQYRSSSVIGDGYQFELNWGETRPTGRAITVVAHYVASRKTEIYSAPAGLALSGR